MRPAHLSSCFFKTIGSQLKGLPLTQRCIQQTIHRTHQTTTDWVDFASGLTSASLTCASDVFRMSLKVRSGIFGLTRTTLGHEWE